MSYKFIEHTGDIAVEIEAASLHDLFAFACHAWRDSAIENHDYSSTDWKTISVLGNNYEDLLILLLNELNFLLYSEKWVFNSVENIEFIVDNSRLKLKAEILGSPFSENQFQLKEEIKAVTYHQVKIQNIGDKFFTRIVFDI